MDDYAIINSIRDYIRENLHEGQSMEKEHSVTSLIKISLLEKIITKFIFQYKTSSNEFGLTHILNFFNSPPESDNNYENTLRSVKNLFEYISSETKRDCLSCYFKLIEAITGFPKLHTSNPDITIENAVKIEKLMQEHIDNNLFNLKPSKRQDDLNYHNEQFIRCLVDRYDLSYSVNCIQTLFSVLKKLEKINISINDNDMLQEEALISEKRVLNLEKNTKKNSGFTKASNIVDYFINEGHIKKLLNQLYSTEPQYNNYEIENKLCLSLFLIRKIIQDYSFYFSKQELESIFLSMKKFKDFPLPIGNFGMDLFEVLLNELYFQGITITNKLRERYMFDSIEQSQTKLSVKLFNRAVILIAEDERKQEITKVINYIMKQPENNKSSSESSIDTKEFLVKLFISVVRNSNFPINNEILDNIIRKFMTQKKQESANLKDPNVSMESDNNEAKKKIDNTNVSIKKLLRIIDVGLDKSHDDFMEDIAIIAEPLVQIENTFISVSTNKLPLTDFRDFLQAELEFKNKVLYDSETIGIEPFNLFQFYTDSFKDLFTTYFFHLDDYPDDSVEILPEKRKKRINILNEFRLKIVLLEDKKSISCFLYQLLSFNKQKEEIMVAGNWDFWSKFYNSPEEFEIKYILFLVPNIEHLKEVLPKHSEEAHPYLTDFIANHDHIYQILLYNPWLCKKENDLDHLLERLNEFPSTRLDFKTPDEFDIFSYLKDSLHLYTSEADKIFNLNLYHMATYKHQIEKLFWRSVEIKFVANTIKDKDIRKKGDSAGMNVVEFTFTCVDMLGLEYNNSSFSFKMNNPYEMKIFNVFTKKDIPMNYNMTSNNGWLEVFILESPSDKLPTKYPINKEKLNYIHELVEPLMEVDSVYKNFKVSKLEVASNQEFTIFVDDKKLDESKI